MSDILIVDDEKDIRELISDILEDEGFGTRVAGNADDCMKEISDQQPGLMILDIWLKDSHMDGIDILKAVKRDHPNVPVIIISGHGNIEIAVAAIKQGAYDFIEKPFNIEQLLTVIRRGMETSRLRRENEALKQKDSAASDMLGDSPAFKSFVSQLQKVMRSNGRVMLMGPAGSGKELAARYIHQNSSRKAGAFVCIPCTTIDPENMEKTLFGSEGSGTTVRGLLEEADGGTIYLDEITDIPLSVQSKLLRILVDQTFHRVGGTTPIKVDLRVISSTSREIEAEVKAERFRSDLFHRLNVVPIMVPSLEERREDIPLLAEHFLENLHQDQGLPLRSLGEDTATLLQARRWPGNIRQLRNVIEQILILSDETGTITTSEVPSENTALSEEAEQHINLSGQVLAMPLREAREIFEREYLMTQIGRFNGNISRTADFVGMERSALHRKLKSLGLTSPQRIGGGEDENGKGPL